MGRCLSDLEIYNAQIINVFTKELLKNDSVLGIGAIMDYVGVTNLVFVLTIEIGYSS